MTAASIDQTMIRLTLLAIPLTCLLTSALAAGAARVSGGETAAGWVKFPKNPVLGGSLGTCFDVCVLRVAGQYRMWFSWRPKRAIALVESPDGLEWGQPTIVLGPNNDSGWEEEVNRPAVIRHQGKYHMWYTGQAKGGSWIGHATSDDGKTWKRTSSRPVLSPAQPWERQAVMCPHVLFDDRQKCYRLWYSGGEQYEPNAIGYATSEDAVRWTKHRDNPIFGPEPKNAWEKDRVTGCQVFRLGQSYAMLYIGFSDRDHAQIGVARSRDGITGWERHPANPILRPGAGRWDADAVYKPYALFDGKRWLLWYNGRRGGAEQIGVAIHDGEDIGF